MMDILMSETCWAHKKWNKNSKWHQVGLLFASLFCIYNAVNVRLYIADAGAIARQNSAQSNERLLLDVVESSPNFSKFWQNITKF